MYTLQDPVTRPWKTTVRVADHDLIMEVDTGTSVTVISEATLGHIWVAQPAPPLQLTNVRKTEDLHCGRDSCAWEVGGPGTVPGPRGGTATHHHCRRWA